MTAFIADMAAATDHGAHPDPFSVARMSRNPSQSRGQPTTTTGCRTWEEGSPPHWEEGSLPHWEEGSPPH